MDELVRIAANRLARQGKLKLANAVAKQQDRIKELESGRCRFNCRTRKEIFIEAYERGFAEGLISLHYDPTDAEEAYKEWKSEKRD